MIDKICTIRKQLVSKVDGDIAERGLDRIDVQNLGEVVDMIKDLAVAEEKLRKADYYHRVIAAMDGGEPMRTSHPEIADAISRALSSADPHERETIKGEVMAMLA